MKREFRKDTHDTELLQNAGLRVTNGRRALLRVLAEEKIPLSVERIRARMKPLPDKVTLYRSLEALVEAGIARRIDLGHAHAHYELAEGRAHHHHLVCQRCGIVEDIKNCSANALQKTSLKKSKLFASVQDHSLELFGVCKACAKK